MVVVVVAAAEAGIAELEARIHPGILPVAAARNLQLGIHLGILLAGNHLRILPVGNHPPGSPFADRSIHRLLVAVAVRKGCRGWHRADLLAVVQVDRVDRHPAQSCRQGRIDKLQGSSFLFVFLVLRPVSRSIS